VKVLTGSTRDPILLLILLQLTTTTLIVWKQAKNFFVFPPPPSLPSEPIPPPSVISLTCTHYYARTIMGFKSRGRHSTALCAETGTVRTSTVDITATTVVIVLGL
jgi:hypothetical protein